MQIRRTTGFLVLSLMTAFFLAACGGGGDSGGGGAKTPVTTTLAALPITTDNATINGAVNPNGDNTVAWFEWGTNSGLSPFNKTPDQTLGSGTADIPVTSKLTGLTSGTTYYFRVAASNPAGTVKGTIVSFVTAAPNTPPAVQTLAHDNLSISGATLHGSVIPNGLATNAYFEWGTDNTFVTPNVTPSQAMGSDLASHQISANLTGLTTGTKYYFRVVATNSAGTSKGAPASFTTNTLSPTVQTNPATSVTTNGAVLNGDVNPNGLATTYHFEWGTDNTFTTFNATPVLSAGTGISSAPVTASISGLTLGTKYYFRITANNSAGDSTGTIRNFTTVNPPPTANAGPDQTVYMLGAFGRTEVTLDGSGSTDGGGGTLTYLWTPPAGVTLSDPTAAKPTFTAPVITYPPDAAENLQFSLIVTSSRGPVSVQDNVSITVKWAFLDDFSVNSISTYTVTKTWGVLGTFTYHTDAASVTTGASNGLMFEHGFGLIDTGLLPIRAFEGVFALNYTRTATHAPGGGIEIRIGEDFNNCYVISPLNGWVAKRFNGSTVDNVAFNPTITTGTGYFIKIVFTPDLTTVEAFGQTISLSADPTPVPVEKFFITTVEQDAYYDNITLDEVY